MTSYWNERALDCREALEWLDTNLEMPVGIWLAAHTALSTHLKDVQKWVSEECEEWF